MDIRNLNNQQLQITQDRPEYGYSRFKRSYETPFTLLFLEEIYLIALRYLRGGNSVEGIVLATASAWSRS